MPVYDFNCSQCGATASIATAITADITNPICASCKQTMIRSYNFGAVQFNGSGFYSTDKGAK